MNILITSAGRRTYIAEYFREALSGSGLVYAANSEPCPAFYAADGHFLTPLIHTDEYIPFLLDRCRKLHIDLLLSLFDVDLPVLAAHREEFEALGVRMALSGPDATRVASDKFLMCETLKAAGIATPRTVLSAEEASGMDYPLIVKPRLGMGSIGLYEAYSGEELRAAFSMCRRRVEETYLRYEAAPFASSEQVIAQEMIPGREYGLDVVCDLDGEFVSVLMRKKIAMRSGETSEAVTIGPEDSEYAMLWDAGEAIAGVLHPIGLIDVDLKLPEGSSQGVVIDINLRFGGGYPFSHLAGADVPRAYVLWAQGKNEEAAQCLSAAGGVRGYKDIALRPGPYE